MVFKIKLIKQVRRILLAEFVENVKNFEIKSNFSHISLNIIL
jgi:hypothetical protein